ncbi:MAG: LpxI family protein [Gemmataceae bacterium]
MSGTHQQLLDAIDNADRPIGLLAGSGKFPIHFAKKAYQLGRSLVTVGLRGEAAPALKELSSEFYWTGVAKLGRTIRCFRNAGVQHVVMAGKVQKTQMYTPWRIVRFLPDWRTIKVWFNRHRKNNSDDNLLLAVINEFAKDGIEIVSALDLCPELLVKSGTLTTRVPTVKEMADVRFGWYLAKEMGRLDVGQSVAVKESAVLAVEAIEGTDKAILRAGQLCPVGGFVVVKVAKPQQDTRFDVPTIGTDTIETMKKAGARVLAVEDSQTILIDEAETIALANRNAITIVSCSEQSLTEDAPLLTDR